MLKRYKLSFEICGLLIKAIPFFLSIAKNKNAKQGGIVNPNITIKRYKLSFEICGLLLFLIVMIPNFIWFAIPAPNDILRTKSITETVDTRLLLENGIEISGGQGRILFILWKTDNLTISEISKKLLFSLEIILLIKN